MPQPSDFLNPGSWLEVPNYNHQTISRIFSFNQVKCIIIQEDHDLPAPLFPFIIVIENADSILKSKWKSSPQFQGFLWRTNSIPELFPSHISAPIWIDLIVDDFKKAKKYIEIISLWPIKACFLSPTDNVTPSKLNLLLKMDSKIAKKRPHDLYDSDYQKWIELENFDNAEIEKNSVSDLKLSIIIPHFENPYFLCNTLKHLQIAFESSSLFEVLVVDDGSSETCFNQISYFIHRKIHSMPIRLFRWKEKPLLSKDQKIFRAGASRNWGASFAKSDCLFFLDSDMLTPAQIAIHVLQSLENYDVIQFVRHHIPSELSSETTLYREHLNSSQLYIEEASYWNKLFRSHNWTDLPDYWKYTCTYALALKKKTFFEVGRIRRNFIHYGFEDTDLGYRLFKAHYSFKLNSTPLLHLTTQQDKSQGLSFKIKKMNRIKPMAKLFYRLNLDAEIYEKFQSLLD